MADIYQIADAVTSAINAATLPISFTATRVYMPLVDVSKVSSLTVLVAPRSDDFEILSRDGNWERITIGVFVYAKLPAGTDPTNASGNTVIDPYVQLCRAIALVPGTQSGETLQFGDAIWDGTKYDPIFDTTFLRTDSVFAGLVKFTFRQEP